MFTKKEVEKLLDKKGDARGVVFQTDADYVKSRFGEEGIKKVEALLKEWGVGLRYNEVDAMEWYPVAWRVLSLAAIKVALDWQNADIREMGRNAPKVSIIVKLYFKLFPSIKKFVDQVPGYWRKHYTIGALEAVKLDEGNKEMIVRVKDFISHPLLCTYLEGYFERTIQLTRPEDSRVKVKELHCSFREDVEYQEFKITWTT